MNIDDAKDSILPPPLSEGERISLHEIEEWLRSAKFKLHRVEAEINAARRGIERFGRNYGAAPNVGSRCAECERLRAALDRARKVLAQTEAVQHLREAFDA